MSPRSRMPSGKTFLEPPNNKHVMAFLISESQFEKDVEMTKRIHTQTSVYTWANTFGKSFIEAIASCHFAIFFFFFWCKLYAKRIRPSAIRRPRCLQVNQT